MSDKGTVFTVKFACDNCGKEWSLEFHEKVRVWRHNPVNAPDHECIIASDACEKPMVENAIYCPNCETSRDVKIVQRIPIEERKTVD